jgi:predicted AAA+ superfamily ATPase
MYLNPNKKNCLTNVLLFARRCNKFDFYPCSFSEFSMIHTVYCMVYQATLGTGQSLAKNEPSKLG